MLGGQTLRTESVLMDQANVHIVVGDDLEAVVAADGELDRWVEAVTDRTTYEWIALSSHERLSYDRLIVGLGCSEDRGVSLPPHGLLALVRASALDDLSLQGLVALFDARFEAGFRAGKRDAA